MQSQKTKKNRLPRSLQYTKTPRTVWWSTSSRKPVWMPFSSMQACVKTGKCTKECSRPAPKWVLRIVISSQLIRVTSCTVHTREVIASLRLWTHWNPINLEIWTPVHSATVAEWMIEHPDTSINSHPVRNMVIKGTETNEEIVSKMERLTLSSVHSLYMIRDRI